MHNRRCSEAEPTDRQHPTPFFKAPHGARLSVRTTIISPPAGLRLFFYYDNLLNESP
ncbi:MAG: hypothetical protein LBP87_12495 [Planctomycetaceae bacterium]|nr:hypothetical protein [Planctomycetaceae bacterium]